MMKQSGGNHKQMPMPMERCELCGKTRCDCMDLMKEQQGQIEEMNELKAQTMDLFLKMNDLRH